MSNQIEFKPDHVICINEANGNNIVYYNKGKTINSSRIIVDKPIGRPPKNKRIIIVQAIMVFEEVKK